MLQPGEQLALTQGHRIASASTSECDPRSAPRKKKRVYTSCRQCRKRRCACSREYPCHACVSRNEGDQCDWTGASPQFVKSKGQINHDSLLIRQENPARMRIKHDFQNLHSHVESLIGRIKQKFPASTARVIKPEIVPVTNYHIEDIATQLSRFTLNQAIRHQPETPLQSNPNLQISVKEVKEYLEKEEKKSLPDYSFNMGSGGFVAPSSSSLNSDIPSSATSPVMEGFLGIGKGPSSFEAVLKELPKPIQIKACLEQFEHHRAWMHRILHRPTFWKQVLKQIQYNFSYTDQRAQAHWLAILFSVCGLGLFNNTIKSGTTLKDYELPSSVKDQRALALRWCRAATSCLEIGAFETAPTMDSICAMAILAQLPLYTSNGETLGLALEFIGKGIDLAMQLDLHIDPDSHPVYQNATALVKQNRRRLMVALLCQHYKMGGLLCQDHKLRPLEQFSGLQLPLDQFDEDFSEDGQLVQPLTPGTTHTIMTGVRCRFQVSRIWQEIGLMFSKPDEPPTHETVIEINTKLQQLQSEWPASIWTEFNPSTCTFTPPFTLPPQSSLGLQVLLIDRLGCFAVFAAAMVRLHRGFLIEIDGVPFEDIKMHREQVYHYGRAMLAIHRTKVFPLDNVLQLLVTSSEEDNKCEVVAQELQQVKAVLKLCTGLSSILRRTYAVLDFALNKWATMKHRTDPSKSRPHKRFKADADNIAQQQDSSNANFTRNQIAISGEVTLGSGADNHVEPIEPVLNSGYDPWMIENLSKILMQDQQWPEDFDLPHDKLQQQEPQLVCSSSFAPFVNSLDNLDLNNLFQFQFSQPLTTGVGTVGSTHILSKASGSGSVGNAGTSGNARTVSNPNLAGKINTTLQSSGSSIPYLSTSPPSSSNLMRQSVHNEEELNASPLSLNYPSTLPFGSSFSKNPEYHQTFAHVTYPILPHHPLMNASCINSETLLCDPSKTHPDPNFDINGWDPSNTTCNPGYNIFNSKSI